MKQKGIDLKFKKMRKLKKSYCRMFSKYSLRKNKDQIIFMNLFKYECVELLCTPLAWVKTYSG